MSDSSVLNSDKAPEPVGLYPHARKVGNLLFLSGVGPRERGTKKILGVELDEYGDIASYDIETQCHSVFNNVKLILEASGSSWGELVGKQPPKIKPFHNRLQKHRDNLSLFCITKRCLLIRILLKGNT